MSIAPKTSSISVIIPTRNESERLPATLAAVAGLPDVEVLVVDGGSSDNTLAVARDHGARVLVSPPGRGLQMNRGAQQARGEILLFLHGDTVLPAGFQDSVRHALARPGVAAGAFTLAFADATAGLKAVAWGANRRSRWLQLPYGDQALFVRQELFSALGGFPVVPIMEDVVLVRALRRHGRIALLPQAVTTSARRWHRRGVVANTVRNQCILVGFFLGLPLGRLAQWYRLGEKG